MQMFNVWNSFQLGYQLVKFMVFCYQWVVVGEDDFIKLWMCCDVVYCCLLVVSGVLIFGIREVVVEIIMVIDCIIVFYQQQGLVVIFV